MNEKQLTKISLSVSFIGILLLLTLSFMGNVVAKEGPFLVVRILDGDTLELENGDIIRLSGLDTPETGTCYAAEAKAFLSNLTLNKQVKLEKDIDDTGKYNRKLRYIYVNDTSVNAALVKSGHAKVFDKYNETTRRYKELKEIEKYAIRRNLGVWQCEDPLEGCIYIRSENSKTYHKPECKWAKRIKPENRVCITSEDELEGLEPAKSC